MVLNIDGIVGEVLFWVMRRCLGEAYDDPMHRVWVLIVSRMIKIMIPGDQYTHINLITHPYNGTRFTWVVVADTR